MKKGFTLLELIAVIMLIAILAMIVVPNVTSSLSDSEKSSKILSAKGFVEAVNNQIIENINNNELDMEDNVEISVATLVNTYHLKYSGVKPSNDSWVKVNDDEVIVAHLKYEEHIVTCGTTVASSCNGDKYIIKKASKND